MPHTAYEMIWLKNLLMELGFKQPGPMPKYCDNHFVIYIAKNRVFHERTKHIEVDCHFSEMCGRKRWLLVRTFFEAASRPSYQSCLIQVFSNLCNKLGMLDIYAPVLGGVLV